MGIPSKSVAIELLVGLQYTKDSSKRRTKNLFIREVFFMSKVKKRLSLLQD